MALPKVEQRKCVYCQIEQLHSRDRKLSHFSAEHVIHAGLTGGVKGLNPTLIGLVCESCNAYFGRVLDQNLLRSGYIGMLRFESAQKHPDKFHEFDGRSLRLTAYKEEESAVHGTAIRRSVRGGQLLTEFEAAAAIELESGWHHLTEQQIDNGEVPKIGAEQQVNFKMMCDPDDEPRVLEKLKKHYNITQTGRTWTIGVTPVFGEGELTETDVRCLVKVAFNYLTFICERVLKRSEQVFDPCLHEIRNFIRFGSGLRVPPLTVEEPDNMPWDGEVQPRERLSHSLRILQEAVGARRPITVSLNLFNSMTLAILLAEDSSAEFAALDHGHFWDLKAGSCTAL